MLVDLTVATKVEMMAAVSVVLMAPPRVEKMGFEMVELKVESMARHLVVY